MPVKQVKQLLDSADEQNWTVRETKNGYQLLAPNGTDIVLIHRTQSDHRWLRNTVARMRRFDPSFQWKDR
jgi:hypothetical protein